MGIAPSMTHHRLSAQLAISIIGLFSGLSEAWGGSQYPYDVPVPVEKYWSAWAHAKVCEDQNALKLSPVEILEKVRLSRSPPEKLAWHTPPQFRQLKCWKPKKEADFSIKLPTDAAVTGSYTGKHVGLADPIAENFIVAPLRLYDDY